MAAFLIRSEVKNISGSNTFGGTIKLEGESEYRSALSQINSDLRVLASSMSVVTAEYGKNDNSTQGLTERNKVLSDQIDKQKERVSLLQSALSDSSDKYGDNDKKTQSWQVSLNKAQAQLIGMQSELDSNNETLENGSEATDDNAKSVQDLGDKMDDSSQKAFSFGDMLKANLTSQAIIEGVKKLGQAISDVADKIKDAVVSSASYADNIESLSVQTGLSTKSLQEYSAVSGIVDVDLTTMTDSMAKNIKSMSSAKDGTGDTAEAYKKLGISVTDSQGNLLDGQTTYWKVIDSLGNMQNTTERDALAMTLLGKSAQDLNPLIAEGSSGIADLSQKADDMGAVMSDDSLNALNNLDDSMKNWNTTISAVTNSIGAALAPALTDIIDKAGKVGSSFGSLVKSMVGGDSDVDAKMEAFKTSVSNLTQAISERMPEFIALGGKILEAVAEGIGNAISPFLGQIAGWGLLIVGAIILIIPPIQAAISLVMAAITGALALWPVALGIALAGLAIAFWPQISAWFADLWSHVSVWLSGVWDNISGFLGEHWQDILLWIVAWPVALVETLAVFWPQISAWLSGLWSNISGWLSSTWINISNWFGDLKTNAGNKTSEVVNTVGDWFKKLPSNIWNAIVGAVDGIANWGSQMASRARDAAVNVFNNIVDNIKNLPSRMLEIGGNLVSGLCDGINNMTSWVISKIKGFSDTVLSGIKNFFGIHSPSTLMRDQIGKNMALGISEGFTSQMQSVTDDMISAVPTDFSASVSAATSAGAYRYTYGLDVVGALQKALTGMAFMIDGDKMGEMVISKVEKVVYS